MDKIHVRFSISQPCLTDAVIVILNGLLSYEHPSNARGVFVRLINMTDKNKDKIKKRNNNIFKKIFSENY